MAYVIIEFPMQTVSELNMREHWRSRHKRRAAQRREVNAEWKRKVKREIELPCAVTLTRIAPKMLDTGDNLASAFKATKDEVAALLGVDDSSQLIQWHYRQEAIGERRYGVRIEIEDIF